MTSIIEVEDLGSEVPYLAAVTLQEHYHAARCSGTRSDSLLLLEHSPVYTLGRSAEASNIRWSRELLAAAGIDCVKTSRGGDVTYHGPGQLVGYPIINLTERNMGVVDYITAVEEVLIATLHELGITAAGRDKRNRGVWVGNDKIVAIGIKVSRRVTLHGFAFNVNTRLADYAGIVPCGLQDAGVTSLARLLGHEVPLAGIKRLVTEKFVTIFGYASANFTTRTVAADSSLE